jgi:hypothetical protein
VAEKISDNLARINERLARAARQSGRDLSEVSLVAVTKSVDVKAIKEAVKAGVRVFGESYIQESTAKIKALKRPSIKWHFIGHLQKNKAKYAVKLFDMIESVDSLSLAKELNKRAEGLDGPLDVLIQVKLAEETTKGGVSPSEVVELAHKVAGLENIALKGLMTIPPYTEDPEKSRPYFTTLRRIAERVRRERIPGVSMSELSMGMSADFDVAVEEGATIIRIGTALFGERKKSVK